MKKSLALLLSFLLSVSVLPVHAEEESSQEEDWYEKCTGVLSSSAEVEACQAFLASAKEQETILSSRIAAYESRLSEMEKSAQEIEELIASQKELITDLNTQIASKEETIAKIETSIAEVQSKIDAKQAQIDVLDKNIQARMQQEQAGVGTSMLVDILMGSTSLADLVRRMSGIERITQADQLQVDELEQLKAQLDFQLSEKQRLKDTADSQKQELEEQRSQAEELEASYEALAIQYQQQMAEIKQAKMDAQADFESIRAFTISAEENLANTLTPVDGLIFPVKGGTQSAGTWAYPSGGLHLGLDWASAIGTEIVAPADGLILYASNPVPSDSGYLGNWSGWPAGGGNTVGMLCNVKGTLYFINFNHLAQEGMAVKAGDTVSQGDVLALSGNSGNSSGAHTHIEIINLGDMSVSDAVSYFSKGADFSFGTGWNTTATACENGTSAPCRMRPEDLLLKG